MLAALKITYARDKDDIRTRRWLSMEQLPMETFVQGDFYELEACYNQILSGSAQSQSMLG